MFGEVQLVGDDEGEKGDGFAGAGGTFEDCVAACVESLFEVAHVGILFWRSVVETRERTRVDSRIWE